MIFKPLAILLGLGAAAAFVPLAAKSRMPVARQLRCVECRGRHLTCQAASVDGKTHTLKRVCKPRWTG